MDPFYMAEVDLDTEFCARCGERLGEADPASIVGTMKDDGYVYIYHSRCAPRELQRTLLWARLRENAWLN